MEILMAAATDRGTVRESNEDFFYYSRKKNLIIVCDGMGGHKAGETASRVAGETMRDIFLYPDLAEIARLGQDITDRLPVLALRLVLGARLANRRLYLMAEQDPSLRGMGTTLAAMAFSDHSACVVHVGDSRIYRLTREKIQALTEDHSWINELLQDRDISAEQAHHFRKKNVLTRALGTHPSVKIDVQWFPLTSNTTFLLCTDGLHNALPEQEILKALAPRDDSGLQKCLEQLVQHAKEVNGSDNITAAAARVRKVSNKASPWGEAKMTIPNEPAKLMPLEDRFIKKQYRHAEVPHASPQRRMRSPRRLLVAGVLLLLLAASGFGVMRSFFNHHGEADASGESGGETHAGLLPASDSNTRDGITVVQLDSSLFDLPAQPSAPGTAADAEAQTTAPGKNAESDSLRAQATAATAGAGDSYPLPAAETAATEETPNAFPNVIERRDENSLTAQTTSLVPQAGGRIYLPGLNRPRYNGALLFVNETLIGPVRQVADVGFFLRPGQYTIAIKDSLGRIMHQRANIKVLEGDVKPLEFNRQN
ncbi:MAG: protein phosphatase 2C domain-containing protein [candidate division KSB1 bacterium]|nr:protein phosphatase 2C domain-containing protein [candidate division KSB1 bacterium]MDZ7273644.1 protein phosphatase 2C domain-containing protein [candidate division KSB1 bacterium]MDZ7286765.1 protein phosphatase 2C domain-containing protein [candidate division KSB1 bacterium]MDZ7299878.1 protein phosphatase 2C domain-containing protein [candidate division KSB1 bacterium]MDZ7305815.1 protein phosphatase 2C domain-containing protein [candidate division KSB1 bacterium]